MILLKQLAQTDREVFPEIFLNLVRALAPTSYAYSSNAETLVKYYCSYLQLGGLNN